MYVEDLCVLLNALWVFDTTTVGHERFRIQLALCLILAGCSAARPSALVSDKNPLCYRHFEFVIIPPRKDAPSICRNRIALVVTFFNIKGGGDP
jgi:hypothetical protein